MKHIDKKAQVPPRDGKEVQFGYMLAEQRQTKNNINTQNQK